MWIRLWLDHPEHILHFTHFTKYERAHLTIRVSDYSSGWCNTSQSQTNILTYSNPYILDTAKWLFTTPANQLQSGMKWHDFVPTCDRSPLMSSSPPAIVSPTDIQRLLPFPPTWGEIKGSDGEQRHAGTGKQEVEPGSHGSALIGGGKSLTSMCGHYCGSHFPNWLFLQRMRYLDHLKRKAMTKQRRCLYQ